MNPITIAFGRYTLTERLAAGTVAEVFRATPRAADGQSLVVVIKRIREDLSQDPQFAGAFVDEAKIAAALDHPNIARVYEWSRQDDVLFIAMEYIEGTNLASLLQSCSEQGVRIPPSLAVYILIGLLAGLAYAHELKDAYGHGLGIVHRCVAPPNIVLSSAGQVKLVDFGMARASSRVSGTRPGVFSGQVTYLAPEVTARGPVDARTDVFSCGVVLYEMLTGRKLHGAEASGAQAVVQAIRAQPPSSVYTDIPEDLDILIDRATALEPAARFDSARQMGQALEGFLALWDRQLDPDELSSFLVEVLSGRSAGKKTGGFAFGEATSHWFAQGEELVRAEVDSDGQLLAAPPEEPAPAAEPLLVAPAGSFSAGSTVLAVEQGGLGRKRHLKTFGIVAGGLVAVVALIALVLASLGDKPTKPQPGAEPEAPQTGGFSGPVQVHTVPAGALVFVDGDPVEPQGDPPRILNLRAGKRSFRLIAPGYLAWQGKVELERGQPKVIEQTLEARTGALVVRSKPSRAMLFVDGKRVGRTPAKIPAVSAAKAHKLVLQARKHAPLRFEVRPSDWPDDVEADFVLDKKLQPLAKKKARKKRRR